jgi:hypothetical protein
MTQAPAAAKAEAEATAGVAPRAEADVAERQERRDASVANEALREQKAKRLGTGHGEREHAPTRYTEFVRASDRPDEVVTIYYDSRANLIARGIIRTPRLAEPTPFPSGIGFVPDPRS